jgi:hypothetical protein
MAEIKNNFLQSKMNKDFDDRIIPNGQYRDALNITVGKSEQDDIGSLQPVLGNYKLPIPADDTDLVCIGIFMDNQGNRIYRFLTNYYDPNPSSINYPDDSYTMKISVYDINSQSYTTLVEGPFLNFSADNSSYINGVNLVENLLFWTDNRNQPRKININTALVNPGYYTTETQISVAKYAPVEPISLIRKATAVIDSFPADNQIKFTDEVVGIVPGMTMIGPGITIGDYCLVTEYDDVSFTVTLYQDYPGTLSIGDDLTFLISTMSDKSDDEDWPGDPDFLEDRYIRFSYRFKYDDGEYSLMAPFTQIAYIPRQKGYFISGDETAAYRSTIVRWMENNINNIELLIPLPDVGSNILNSYKITELDVLYKESDSNAVKVIETIPVQTIAAQAVDTNVYVQPYQSQKPYKTLSEDQTVRVFDAVPVRALAQEVSGNRVMYGNYYSTYTAPSSINYNVTVNPKTSFFTSFVEYPNHTLKQNRNYQVGFVLADKFGRQSPVILSTVDLNAVRGEIATTLYGGSTVYAPFVDSTMGYPDTRDWVGNALLVLINSVIDSNRNIPSGTPGLYATVISKTNTPGFSIISSDIYYNSTPPVAPDFDPIGWKYVYYEDTTPGVNSIIPTEGQWLRGQYTDYVEILNIEPLIGSGYKLTTSGRVNDLYTYEPLNIPDTKFLYYINPIGWYSYKVVVRQQEQDYYNVYLPGMLNGYPLHQTYGSQVIYAGSPPEPTLENGINTTDFPTNETNKTAHIVLINDNINKIPRDLVEVGPDQKQYRSSVELFGRVENIENTIEIEVDTPTTGPADTFTFVISTQTVDFATLSTVEEGDGLWYEGTLPWYANTVIKSITLDIGTDTGTIVFSQLNNVDDLHNVVKILKGKNAQYYPTRKPDTASSIANSRDFDFLQNSVQNITGTAGLNLYQLQTNPIIGRVSTVNEIGVTGDWMVPFLSVYETRADESLLDIFWETTTNGLISDLNWDVLTGSDAPIALNEFDTLFFENQDKDGGSSITGASDSSYITDDIWGINNAGTQVLSTDAEIISVTDGNGNPCAGRFLIEDQGAGAYRIKINDNFVFNHDALTAGLFNFEIRLFFDDVWYNFPFSIQLSNIAPSFTEAPDGYNMEIDSSFSVIQTLTAVNGSFLETTSDLYWTIESGNDENYFDLTQSTGVLSLIPNSNIPNGVYVLQAKVTDAVDFSQQPPSKLSGTAPVCSLEDTCTVVLTVLAAPLDPCLRDFDSGPFIYARDAQGNTLLYPNGYGGVYVGTAAMINVSGFGYLAAPSGPTNGRAWNTVLNVSTQNGCLNATRLTQGAMRWTVSINGFINNDDATTANSKQEAAVDFILWYRENSTAQWERYQDDNGYNYNRVYLDQEISGGNDWQRQGPAGRRFWENTANLSTGSRIPISVINSDGSITTVLTNKFYAKINNPFPNTPQGGPDVYVTPGMFLKNGATQIFIKSITVNTAGNSSTFPWIVEFENNAGLVAANTNHSAYRPFRGETRTSGGLYIKIQQDPTLNWANPSTAKRSTSFVTSTPGEYFLGLRMTDTSTAPFYGIGSGIGNHGPWVDVKIEDANFTYPLPSGAKTRTAYEYNVVLKEQSTDYPSSVPSDDFTTQATSESPNTYEFGVNSKTTASQNPANLDKIKLTSATFTNFDPRYIVNGMWCFDFQEYPDPSPYFAPNTKIVDVDYANSEITVDPATLAPIPANYDFVLARDPDDTEAVVYADTNEGSEVRQFYEDSLLTTPWNPPIPDKFYTFKNKNKDYNIGFAGFGSSMPAVTSFPFFCAKLDGNGKVLREPGWWQSSETYTFIPPVDPPPAQEQSVWFYQNNNNPNPIVMVGSDMGGGSGGSLISNFYHTIEQEITTPP